MVDVTNPITQVLLTRGLWIILAAAILLVIALMTSLIKNKNNRMIAGWIALGAILLVIVPVITIPEAGISQWFGKTLMGSNVGVEIGGANRTIYYSTVPSSSGGSATAGCPYQPTGSYSTKDKFAASVFGGTAYYKTNGQPAVTTATSNLNRGTEYIYWVSNTTTYVKPLSKVADCGVNNFVADAYKNGTATITTYDTVNNHASNDWQYNTSLGANAQASYEITYQPTAKTSAIPFGGVMIVEYNSSMSDLTCTGADLRAGNPSGFHVTYTLTRLTSTYKVFEVASTLDDGSGAVKKISCQFKNGATANVGTQSPWYITFIPANYYLSNDGNFVLDVEKSANADTTRAGLGGPGVVTTYWG